MTSKVLYKGNLRTECIHLKSNSQICTDAPTDNNGKGESFSPTDLVATSLASCMITVMGIKAAQSEIAFSEISASVIKVMGTNPRRIVKIKIDIEVGETWTYREKKIMENTANTCPITKSLHPDIVQDISFIYR
ncbi:OsmC family protein [Bacteroidia bacterium]|nr:OsmC family protein [Bacteroidia bacterium]MDB9882436.1 OsmC family protein [Bacteroidia bacterium]MDC1395423.1 OsmC family protein [Bacteroidia bacterium]